MAAHVKPWPLRWAGFFKHTWNRKGQFNAKLSETERQRFIAFCGAGYFLHRLMEASWSLCFLRAEVVQRHVTLLHHCAQWLRRHLSEASSPLCVHAPCWLLASVLFSAPLLSSLYMRASRLGVLWSSLSTGQSLPLLSNHCRWLLFLSPPHICEPKAEFWKSVRCILCQN